MKPLLLISLIVVMTVHGCSVAPKTYTFPTTAMVSIDPETAQRRVVAWCGQHGFAVTSINQGIVIAKSDLKAIQGARDAGFGSMSIDTAVADCGGTGVVDYNATEGMLNVTFETERGVAGGTQVRVTFIPSTPGSITCVSNGRIERMILESLKD